MKHVILCLLFFSVHFEGTGKGIALYTHEICRFIDRKMGNNSTSSTLVFCKIHTYLSDKSHVEKDCHVIMRGLSHLFKMRHYFCTKIEVAIFNSSFLR